jgi:hypothetical protein
MPLEYNFHLSDLDIEALEVLYNGMFQQHKPLGPVTMVEGIPLHNVHAPEKCALQEACVVHFPSDHHMRGMKLHWRGDREIFERICAHGCGHPDPDDMAYQKSINGDSGVHGCDGCCVPPEPTKPTVLKSGDVIAMPIILEPNMKIIGSVA